MQSFPEVCKLLDLFKARCLSKGWKTSENYDWVFADTKYHMFIWAKKIHPSTFERIVSSGKCIVKQGLYYKIVNAAYFAWLLESSLSQGLLNKTLSDDEVMKKTAIYDFSEIYKGKDACLKINKTESEVFNEFEEFLRELGVKFVPLLHSTSLKNKKILISR